MNLVCHTHERWRRVDLVEAVVPDVPRQIAKFSHKGFAPPLADLLHFANRKASAVVKQTLLEQQHGWTHVNSNG